LSGNIFCARCRATVPSSEASYTDDGSLVCGSCSAQAAVRQADAAIYNYQAEQRSSSNWITARLIIVGIKLVILFFGCLIYAIAKS
jgi:hypothetical protein